MLTQVVRNDVLDIIKVKDVINDGIDKKTVCQVIDVFMASLDEPKVISHQGWDGGGRPSLSRPDPPSDYYPRIRTQEKKTPPVSRNTRYQRSKIEWTVARFGSLGVRSFV